MTRVEAVAEGATLAVAEEEATAAEEEEEVTVAAVAAVDPDFGTKFDDLNDYPGSFRSPSHASFKPYKQHSKIPSDPVKDYPNDYVARVKYYASLLNKTCCTCTKLLYYHLSSPQPLR